jgi:hypothetical protein
MCREAMKTSRLVVTTIGIGLAALVAAASNPGVQAQESKPAIAMSGTLVLTTLKVKSSYLQGVEEPARPGEAMDTIQWWIGGGQVWRITTFALDHDVRAQSMDAGTSNPVEFARKSNRENYGEIIRTERVLKFDDCTDATAVARVLKAATLPNRLQVEAGRFAFWKPDAAEYRLSEKATKAAPLESPEPSK